MPLTDVKVRSAKPKSAVYRLLDAGDLYLEVTPSGGRYWRLKYRFAGKEKRLALGVYPTVSLEMLGPSMQRECRSSMTARYSQPTAAPRYVMSVTQT